MHLILLILSPNSTESSNWKSCIVLIRCRKYWSCLEVLMLCWWLTPGVSCIVNENGQHASGHSTLGRVVELAFAFAVFLFCSSWAVMVQWALLVEKSRVIKCLCPVNGSTRRERLCRVRDRKGNPVCSVILHYYLWLHHFDSVHLVCPLSDVVLQCFETPVPLLFLLSVAALWPEPCWSLWS